MQQKTAGLFSFGGCLGGLGARALLDLSSALDREPKIKAKNATCLHVFQCTTSADGCFHAAAQNAQKLQKMRLRILKHRITSTNDIDRHFFCALAEHRQCHTAQKQTPARQMPRRRWLNLALCAEHGRNR